MEPYMDSDAGNHGLLYPVRATRQCNTSCKDRTPERRGADAPAAQVMLVTETRGT
jgi:hypothetical protein